MRTPENTAAWTPERIQLLREFLKQGLSYGLIAARLGGGLTRSAISGKCKRLRVNNGMPGAVHHAMSKAPQKPRVVRVPPSKGGTNPNPAFIVERRRERQRELAAGAETAPYASARKVPDAPGSHPVPMSSLDLTFRKCRWPCDVPAGAEALFCADVVPEGQRFPYCNHHMPYATGRRVLDEEPAA